jgi:hypothetical protein
MWAYAAFIKYKAENAGVLGLNRRLTIGATVMMALSGSLIMTDPSYSQTPPGIAVSFVFVVVYLVISVLCRLALTRSLRKLFNKDGLITYGLVMAVMLATILFAAAGGFGYSKYQPRPHQIAAASISYHGAPQFIPGRGNYYGSFMRINAHMTLFDPGDNFTRHFTELRFETEEDIQAVLNLHREIIDAGLRSTPPRQWIDSPETDWVGLLVRVRYYLKDGGVTDRLYYDIPVRIALKLPELDNTAAIQSRITAVTALASQAVGAFPVTVTDNLFSQSHEIAPSNQLALLTALQTDINRLPLGEKYFPDRAARVVVRLPRLIELDGVIGQPEYTALRNMGEQILMETGIRENKAFPAPFSGPPFEPSVRTMHWLDFYITDSYTETLAFLEEQGMGRLFDKMSGLDMENIFIEARCFKMFPLRSAELYFTGGPIHGNDTRSRLWLIRGIPEGDYPRIMARARTHYYGAAGGYRLYVTWAEYGEIKQARLFLPEADAPPFIKEAARKINYNRP